eukprot:6471829-Lingulodinium_polyedra.AAC.1
MEKRSVMQVMVDASTVVLLQETHWTPETAPLWPSGVFHHTDVARVNARGGPRGGPQGGAAILVPAPLLLVRQEDLVVGCAVAARV